MSAQFTPRPLNRRRPNRSAVSLRITSDTLLRPPRMRGIRDRQTASRNQWLRNTSGWVRLGAAA